LNQVPAIGLFGGTFDPIHFAHLRLAEEVTDAFELEKVHFIPTAVPPHRNEPSASPAHRLAMTRLATQGNPRFVVDGRELKRAGTSYTFDTLSEIRAESHNRPLCLLMGADAFVALTTWHRWNELFDLAHFVVARRPGFPLEQLASSLPGPLRAQYLRRHTADPAALKATPAGNIFAHELTALDVSATELRTLITRHASLRYLLPDAVIAYIEEHRLYKERDAS
jgi:nicotinate-nucleotide adenylyltransferase